MKQASPRILVVDDDINVRESLSTILQSEGYSTVSVENAREALEKARNRFFDLVLLDIRLPDAEGAQLLSQFQEVAPETVKIVITGYPSVENAAQALNIGADSYLVKPIDPECLLKTIRDKLKEREQNEKFTTKKLEDWIRLRLFKTESSDFHEFLEKTSKELALFGLTGTQAKIYIGLNALSVASASEIAHLSGIAREEVYRVMPELEKLGLATRRLGTPRRYLATNVKTVLETLIEIKRKAMEGEIFSLRQKKSTLIARLELTTELKTKDEHSTEIFSEPMSALVKLDQMIKKAKRVIMLAIPLNQLGKALVRETQKIIEIDKNQIRIQIITDNSRPEQNAHFEALRPILIDKQIELRRVEMLPFNLLIVDEEAIWGEFQAENADSKIFLTNEPKQVSLVGMAFNNLWEHSQKVDESLDLFVGKNQTRAAFEN